MESNGKRVTKDGKVISEYSTGPIIWGEPGTNLADLIIQLVAYSDCKLPQEPMGNTPFSS